ncbi:MAG: HAMP domain-containing protein [Rhodocyclales bacterium]|jgi:two-component system osmolarity sensor histidine kinase EnvZ|nr:HAMP domain-containing protein [Rhodocyclales bacterium]CAG0956716.1 two-component system, OmpR family, osmolarity sensor histidine kinase EnvZ [Rhodocyclaceae bacterium]
MHLLPQSLLWRTFLLIAGLMVLAVMAWAAIFARAEREPRARELARMVVSVVNLTRAALLTTQPDKRLELLIELSDREGIRVYPAEDEEKVAPLPERAVFLQMVAAEVRRQLGGDTRISVDRDGEAGFWVSFRIEGDDEYWVMLPRERVERSLSQEWLGWGAAVLLLALAGAYLIMFRVARPLKALAAAARDIGQGRQPPQLAETGPGEIRRVTHAFNQMSSELARLDEDRALILAGISHDLRTPLTRLRLAAEMSPDDAMREGISADIEEIDKIIRQFLDFARNTEGEPPEPTDLNSVLAHIAEPLMRRGARIELHLAELPALMLRPLALLRLAANLINNALRHGGGNAPVEVQTRREGEYIILEVMDRGPGIPPEEAERLKQPFTRLETARTGAASAGLGLAIVERVARGHGGRFDLLPREGGGLVARVTLPALPATLQQA